MGGANGALPVDTSTILVNPAGLSKIGNHVDIGAHYLKADRYRDLSRTDPSIGVANTAAGTEESHQTVYLTPFSGVSYKAEDSRWAFGGIIAGVAGEGAKYRQPRLNPALLEGDKNYDTESFLFVLKAAPGVSYDATDRLTLGASLQINAAFFSGDFAVPTPSDAPAAFPQTAGSGTLEISYGYALQVGALYDLNKYWTIGTAYQDKTRYKDFGAYKDVIPDFELPPEFRVGLAWHATPKLDVTLDYKWIGWEQVGLFDKKPTEGGFGYVDQHTVGFGVQYKYRPDITLRSGVNYGRTPVRKDVVFANSLAPTVYETSLAVGGEYAFGKTRRNSIAASLVYKVENNVQDDGSGDLFSQVGAGTRIGYRSGVDADIAWTLRF
jgi:long-chain fatty acid transport protein